MDNVSNEARKIPYWKNILVNCPNCWFKWEPIKYRKWNIFLEIILWILFLIPWAIYTALRHINTFCLCPKCKQWFLLEADWDNNLIDMLCNIRRKQLCWFWIIVICFSILWVVSILWIYKIHQKNINENNRTYNYQKIYTYVESQKQVEWKNEVTLPVIKEEKQESKNEKEVKVEKPKDPNEEVREKMQNILKQIDYKYWEDVRHKVDSYIWASCSWDCIDWIVNIKFSDNLWWDSRVVESAAAIWSNNIIGLIPGYFDKIWINYIYKWQTVCNCIFTEYQMNAYTPKGCTYYWYKE
jgi:hypothetical protein